MAGEDHFRKGARRDVFHDQRQEPVVEPQRRLVDAPVDLDPQIGVLERDRVEGQVDLPVVQGLGALDDEVAGVRPGVVGDEPFRGRRGAGAAVVVVVRRRREPTFAALMLLLLPQLDWTAAVTRAIVATAVEWPAAAADCSDPATARRGRFPATPAAPAAAAPATARSGSGAAAPAAAARDPTLRAAAEAAEPTADPAAEARGAAAAAAACAAAARREATRSVADCFGSGAAGQSRSRRARRPSSSATTSASVAAACRRPARAPAPPPRARPSAARRPRPARPRLLPPPRPRRRLRRRRRHRVAVAKRVLGDSLSSSPATQQSALAPEKEERTKQPGRSRGNWKSTPRTRSPKGSALLRQRPAPRSAKLARARGRDQLQPVPAPERPARQPLDVVGLRASDDSMRM